MKQARFEWDEAKDRGEPEEAWCIFLDHTRIIAEDIGHSSKEKRYYCIGRVSDGILTVRFTVRRNIIRIFGAGYWRKGKQIYEEENKIHE